MFSWSAISEWRGELDGVFTRSLTQRYVDAPDTTNGKSPIHYYDYALKLVIGHRADAAREEQIATSRPYMDRHEIGIIPGNGYISAVGSFVCLFLPSSSDCRSRWSLAISDGLRPFIPERTNGEANASP
jgi:hypothetical protein